MYIELLARLTSSNRSPVRDYRTQYNKKVFPRVRESIEKCLETIRERQSERAATEGSGQRTVLPQINEL